MFLKKATIDVFVVYVLQRHVQIPICQINETVEEAGFVVVVNVCFSPIGSS